MPKNDESNQIIIYCECCKIRPIGGQCIINGVSYNLSRTCRYCFMRNPESSAQGSKRNRSANFFQHTKAATE